MITPELVGLAAPFLWIGLWLGDFFGRRKLVRELLAKEKLDGARGPHVLKGETYYLVPWWHYEEHKGE